jgi:hypothetical protein
MEKKDTSLIVAKAKSIREAQDNKDLKIAFFNSTNNAIEIVTKIPQYMQDMPTIQKAIVEWREWFLSEHAEHHKRMVTLSSANVKVGDALTRLQATNNLVELKVVWASLTQDERNQADILAEAQAQRKKYVTPKA